MSVGRRLLAAAVLVCLSQIASACGFHDQAQVRWGVLNWIYPDSLHVGTAVWTAQANGHLPRDPLLGQAELTAEGRRQLGYLRALRLLGQLRLALDSANRDGARPSLAVVLLGPMLWSRYELQGGDLQFQAHVDGPRPGDVVVVTESTVIEALVEERITAHEAQTLGVIRLYGNVAESGDALAWLAAMPREGGAELVRAR